MWGQGALLRYHPVWWARCLQVKRIRVAQVGNGDLAGLAIPGPQMLLGFSPLSREPVVAIQPLSLGCADQNKKKKKTNLGTFCVWSNVCNGEDARTYLYIWMKFSAPDSPNVVRTHYFKLEIPEWNTHAP